MATEKTIERKVFATFIIYFKESLPELPQIVDIVNKYLCNNGALIFGIAGNDVYSKRNKK